MSDEHAPVPDAPELPALHGADYCARTELTTRDPDDPEGRQLIVVAAVGETCERVPVASLPWLLADGLIEPVVPPPPPPRRRADDEPSDEGEG